MSEWFKTWFDSEYYHLLYKDRDQTEAENFVKKIYQYLSPSTNQTMLDLACGKGRHSIHLNKMGALVEGCDYSENSIRHAKQFENDRLQFFTHDMRNELPKPYDYIFNLFTSFGYFETLDEHQTTLRNIYNGLNEKGLFIFDFMNTEYVLNHLVAEETIQKESVYFHIKRELIDGVITKNISFEANGNLHEYREEVRALHPNEIVDMMKNCGFSVQEKFGNYHLAPFDLHTSNRFILVLSK
ncbi:MAG: class I SAM-dependent methyltransferase [Bacteroidetes bacterium]|nr:class I SAM-dependent methyltransferase [Bacteroidota bacterium]